MEDDIRPDPWRISKQSRLQKGHFTTAAQRTQRAIDGNLCVLSVSAVSFCSGVQTWHSALHPTHAIIPQRLIPARRTPMTHEQSIAIDIPADEATALLPILQQGGFTTQPIQQPDLDWQTIVVVIRDATVVPVRM
jgi:hypothetical protein